MGTDARELKQKLFMIDAQLYSGASFPELLTGWERDRESSSSESEQAPGSCSSNTEAPLIKSMCPSTRIAQHPEPNQRHNEATYTISRSMSLTDISKTRNWTFATGRDLASARTRIANRADFDYDDEGEGEDDNECDTGDASQALKKALDLRKSKEGTYGCYDCSQRPS